jgi:hypothetical protein
MKGAKYFIVRQHISYKIVSCDEKLYFRCTVLPDLYPWYLRPFSKTYSLASDVREASESDLLWDEKSGTHSGYSGHKRIGAQCRIPVVCRLERVRFAQSGVVIGGTCLIFWIDWRHCFLSFYVDASGLRISDIR